MRWAESLLRTAKVLGWLLPCACGMSQDPVHPPIPLPAQLIHTSIISAGSTGFSDTVLVTGSQYMHLSMFLPSNNFQLTLMAPNGALYPWDPNAAAYSCLMQPLQVDSISGPVGYVYHFTFKAPVDGPWSIQGNSPTTVSSDWSVLLNANFVSDLTAGVFLTSQKVSIGSPVSASLAAMNGGTPVTDFQTYAQLFRTGDPSFTQSVSFSPVTNPTTGNSTLVAQLPVSVTGQYVLRVVLFGNNPSFERVAVSTFSVYPQGAKLTGTFTQRLDVSYP